MLLSRWASTLLNSLPKQLCRLMGRTLLMLRSFSSSLSSGTMTLVFQAEGKVDVRRQDENRCDERQGLGCLQG